MYVEVPGSESARSLRRRRGMSARNLRGDLMPGIAMILGSTRPGRVGEAVPKWVLDIAGQRGDAELAPAEHHVAAVGATPGQVVSRSNALAPVRTA